MQSRGRGAGRHYQAQRWTSAGEPPLGGSRCHLRASGPPHAPDPARLRPGTRARVAAGRWPTAFTGGRRPHGPRRLQAETPPGSARLRPGATAHPGPDRPPAAFPGLSRTPQAEPGRSEPRPGGGAPAPPAALQAGGRGPGLGEGSARARRPSALTMATPLDLQQSAPSPRGASRGQVTLRPLQAPPSLAPPSGLQAAPRLARF